MKRLDFIMSHVKKRRCLMMSVRFSSENRDESVGLSGAFNLNRYNFPDQRLRLNCFKSNRRLIRCHHDLTTQSDVSHCAMSPVTKTKHK